MQLATPTWYRPRKPQPENEMFIIACSALIFSAPALKPECHGVSDVRAQSAVITFLNKALRPQSASIVTSDDDQEPGVSALDIKYFFSAFGGPESGR